MKHIEKIKEMLNTELEVYSKKNAITATDLARIKDLSKSIKNLCEIMMLEQEQGGYSERRGRSSYERGGSSYDDDMMYSERRGRGRNAKRDSMGRYSSEDGSSYDDMSYARGGRGRGYSRDDGYSNASDDMMSMLGEMMEDANPKEREALKECMRALERM